ncbi:16S rRNA (cytidine1402-2'-O)-methyltransferase [Nitrosospira multiformis]|uniref:Ribosomal RNA small subunit methyltransferase I n=1 Tax=Nitrosospira multiformis TaxID=1231 RepID=A0A2T5IAW8_9PROT|nr:16S rRNA (cytidine(1402)-2'-O)-methyltransferase [Nitrosospira multiformis]PTQ80972.1 16S rRNA (cytidine1402-2'-O)-methyltransferase [Nitrosospira multiformis]
MDQSKATVIPATLYVVATPIGNLRDITLRALDVLAAVDVVAAEDTRTTKHLLTRYAISKTLFALHRHNESALFTKIAGLLSQGKTVAIVTDAGTPAISDPGGLVVRFVREQGFKVVPIPGCNAATCALSVAGISNPHFLFYGFLPTSSGPRRRALANLKPHPYSLIFYEAPHRILECIADMTEVFGRDRRIIFARELTKVFETIHGCPLGEALAWLEADSDRRKGEFVLILSGAEPSKEAELSEQARSTLQLLMHELPLKQAVRLTAEISGESKNRLYSLALSLQPHSNS